MIHKQKNSILIFIISLYKKRGSYEFVLWSDRIKKYIITIVNVSYQRCRANTIRENYIIIIEFSSEEPEIKIFFLSFS